MSITPLSPEEVRDFRALMGWTQMQAAQAVGVSKRTWEGWETRDAAVEKGAPPLYLRLAFAAIVAELKPWASDFRLEVTKAASRQTREPSAHQTAPEPQVTMVQVGPMLRAPGSLLKRGR